MQRRIVLLAAVLGLAGSAPAQAADTDRAPNDPAVGGQLNRCWGQVASQVARLDTSYVNGNGGGMGLHVRSTVAADINGGFASSSNAIGLHFNVEGGRQGVGNVSADVSLIHQTSPGDGGNGQHAINNSTSPAGAALSTLINPLTGQLTALGGYVFGVPGNAVVVELTCALDVAAARTPSQRRTARR